MGKIKKVGICTGGGDCPGLNAVIRSCVRYGMIDHGIELWGIKDSFNGLMDRPYNIRKLELNDVTGILSKGGTILGTTNSGNPFSLKNGNQEKGLDKSKMVVEAYKDLGLDCIIVIGGDGTQGIAFQLAELGINVVGVPKTIDNDLAATDQTVGFDTAVGIASEAAERLHSTAESHDRVMILEVMGRGAGHIALHAGIASGSHIILIPEIPFEYEPILNKITQRKKNGKFFSVIVCAEGAHEANQSQQFKTNAIGSKNLGGIGQTVAHEVSKRLSIDTRVTVLGHTQRGGSPSPRDKILGAAYGVAAIDMVMNQQYGKIVSYQKGAFTQIDYSDVAGRFRPVGSDDPLLKTAESTGICLGRS